MGDYQHTHFIKMETWLHVNVMLRPFFFSNWDINNIKSSPFVCTVQLLLALRARLCNHHHYPIPEYFHHSRKIFASLQGPALPTGVCSPPPLATTNLLSVSVDLPILDISYKCSHTIHGLLYLASCTQHNIFKVHTLNLENVVGYVCTSFFFMVK